MRFACLMYHFLTESRLPERQLYGVPVEVLRRHLDLIVGRALPVLLPAELQTADSFSLVISFDDADKSVIALGAEELNKRGLRAVMFVPTAQVGSRGTASPSDLRRWCAMGHAVGSHTRTHRDLRRLTPREVRREIRDSKAELEEMVGRAVGSLAIPYGACDRRIVAQALLAGYSRVFTSWPGYGATGAAVSGRFSILGSTRASAVERILDRRALYMPQRFLYGLKRAIGSRAYEAFRRRLVSVHKCIAARAARERSEGLTIG